MTSAVAVTAAASYVPPHVVTNDDLAKIMDTSDEWIVAHTGIKTRRFAYNENTSALATKVAEKLLAQAKIPASAIDVIILATISPDGLTPATAAIVQKNIKATNAFAFDISAACSGFVYGISTAAKFLQAGHYRTAMVLAAENNSKMLDFTDRTSAVFFGDGAGGVILQATDDANNMLLAEELHTDGNADVIHSGRIQPLSKLTADYYPKTDAFYQNGRAVYDFVTTTIPTHIESFLRQNNQTPQSVDLIIAHQANQRMLEVLAQELGVDFADKFALNVDRFGNTVSAGIAIGLAEAIANHQRGKVLLTGFGAGLAYGSLLLDLDKFNN